MRECVRVSVCVCVCARARLCLCLCLCVRACVYLIERTSECENDLKNEGEG